MNALEKLFRDTEVLIELKYVDLSMGEHTRFGSALNKFFYSGVYEELKGLLRFMSGCPHTGGMHKLEITDQSDVLLGWLNLFEEHYPFVKEELDIVRFEIKQNKESRIHLRKLIQEQNLKYNSRWLKSTNTFIEEEE